jgi:predicted ATPase
MRSDLPSGTVTFVFTDIEGSTRLLHELGDDYVDVLAEHRRILRESATTHGGVEVDTQGDAFFFAFARARDAVEAARIAQAALAVSAIRVRMGIHTGQPILTDEGYVGLDVHRGARIAAAGHGDQVLLSETTRHLVDAAVRDLGYHRLKDLQAPEHLYQVGDAEFPPLRTLNQTNLPVQPTPFLGRDRELTEVVGLLRREDVRLVTLTGPGGSGKTRLGLQAAAELVEDYLDGVWFVGLAALTDPALVLPTIAQTLGVGESASASFADALAEHLRTKRVLLVLDNLEQLLPDAARPLGELVAAASKVDVVTSSRERLHLSVEQEYPVPPLSLDEAISLFAERARAIRPGFVVDGSRPAVEAICSRVDQLPLAIELAAARTRILSVEQILERLDRRLSLLTTGAADAPERQRTLRATIEWSCELLSEDERALFARLAVFSGGGSLDAAERICAADLDTLGSLIDKSLVRADMGPDEEPRFEMLATIRELALEQLADATYADEVRRRHAEFFLDVAANAEVELRGPDQRRWLRRLELEHDNLRAALRWSFSGGDPELGLMLAARLGQFWYLHGDLSEGRRWLDLAVTSGSATASEQRAIALDWAGYLAAEQGDDPVELLESSRRCALDAGALDVAAQATSHLAALLPADRQDESVPLGEEAVALARASGSRWILGIALNNLGEVFRMIGDDRRALAAYEESYAVRLEIGDRSLLALSLSNLSEMAVTSGDLERARSLSSEALGYAEQLSDRRHVSFALTNLGWIELADGNVDGSIPRFVEALRLTRELGMSQGSVMILHALAGVSAAQGDAVRGAWLEAAAQRHERELDERVGHAPSLADQRIHTRYLDRARRQLGSEAWGHAWAEGAAASLDEAMVYASSIG